MKVCDVVTVLDRLAPPEGACSWDSIGLQAGSREAEVRSVMVCLDVTEPVLEEAKERGCEMIVSHHPFLFHPLTSLCTDTARGRFVQTVAASGMALFAAHTNWDVAAGGVNDALAERLGLVAIRRDVRGNHRLGELPETMPLSAFLATAWERLDFRGGWLIGADPASSVPIRKVGVSSGSFDGDIAWILDEKLDLLVTGEVKHSDAILLEEEGVAVLCAGHYASEIWGARKLAEDLQALLGEDVAVYASQKEHAPYEGISRMRQA